MKIFKKWSLALLLAGVCASYATAQQQMPMPQLPTDPKVRVGKLDNGLTYYIRHNEKPEKRVDFYIAQKVGSIQEEPQQRGLAHFLEHMAFNGTQNFPGDEKGLGIVQWCETKGIKFGTDLNAYTSVDETVYNINNVPVDNKAAVDSCLLILHDWSNYVLLTDKEIDKERGVIREEWRSRNNGMQRIYTDAQSVIYPKGCKYADCMPIGSIDIINNFPYQDLRDYYKKWYHPDLQGIIIVGDIDVDEMEAKVKDLFGQIPAAVNPAKREYYPVPDNQDPIVYIGSDKELTMAVSFIAFKHDPMPDEMKNTVAYYVQSYVNNIICRMMNTRLGEMAQKADAPFSNAGVTYGGFFLSARTKDNFEAIVQTKNEGVGDGMKAVLAELERMHRYGFTQGEYDRAKADYLLGWEKMYNERDKRENIKFCQEYVGAFTDAAPIPGIEAEYQLMQQIVPNIPLEAVNQTAQSLMTENNRVVMIAVPEAAKDKCPDKAAVLAMLNGMSKLDVQPYQDTVSNEPLLDKEPEGGHIMTEVPNQIYGTTKLTLSNGVTVYIKPTDFKADEIRMYGMAKGGESLVPDGDLLQSHYMAGVIENGGLGKFNSTELGKQLAGKNASVSVSMGDLSEVVTGNCVPKDFETMMQLTYLQFTQPHRDNDAFEALKKRSKSQLEAMKAHPLGDFNDSLTVLLHGRNHPRVILMQPEDVDKLDYDRIMSLYKERFGDASGFTFFLVGNVDVETAKPLIAKYLGGLPASFKKETFRDNHEEILPGILNKRYTKAMATPQATTVVVYSGNLPYSLKNNITMSALSQIMDIVYTEEVREKEGGTYGVYTSGTTTKYTKERGLFTIQYQTDPAKVDDLNKIIVGELENVAKNGPKAEHLQKVKDYMLKNRADRLKENGFWIGALQEYTFEGVDCTKDYEKLVNGLTAKDIQQFAKQLLDQGNRATLICTAAESK